MIDDYNRIIDSLNIKLIKVTTIEVLSPVEISHFYDVQNTLLVLNRGCIKFGPDKEQLMPGEMLFLPGGKWTDIAFGHGTPQRLNNEEFINQKASFWSLKLSKEHAQDLKTTFTSVTFDVKAFDSVNFFTSLDIPPFILKNPLRLQPIVKKLIVELAGNQPGKPRMLTVLTDELIMELFRYVFDNRIFVEKLATNTNYFKDPRLIDLFNYIKEHLSGNLSNKELAFIANVSEDYVGQYFKMMTGINPQDYIEYQRMERAVTLLRTSKKSIRAIGTEVGYKDTAYFCRRFKMMFGIPAGKMRRRESLIDM